MKYPQLAAQIFNTPLLVHPQKLDAIIAGLGERLLGAKLENISDISLPAEMFSTRRGKPSEGGYVVQDGVAVIFASGALVHRTRFDMSDSSYFLGYDRLAAQLEAAMEDDQVHAVLQVYDSPGGEVSGAFEYGDRIHAQRGKKPMWAMADSMSASASYLAASAFDQVAVSATGYVGSIGVVMRHVDMSRALANDGIQVTHIFAGSHKVDGNPFQQLPKDVQAHLQSEVDGIYDMFVQAVDRNRAGLDAAAIRGTEARTYRGAGAVAVGLADRVATTDQLISELAALRARPQSVGQSARSTASNPGGSMSGNTQGGQSAANTPVALTRESLEQEHPALFAQLRTEFTAAGASAEQARVKAVRESSLPGHEKLIEALAADGKTTGAEAAAQVLAAERGARQAQASAHASDAPPAAPGSAAPATEAKVEVDASLPVDERCKATWDADPKVRAEFGTLAAYSALVRAEEAGRVKVLGKRG